MAKKLSDFAAPVQVVTLAAVALLIAGTGFRYLVWPLSAQRDQLAKQVADLHAQNVRNRVIEQQHAEYLRRIAEADQQLQLLRTIVPDQPNIDEFIQMVHGAERGSTVHIRSLVAQPLNTRDLYTEMPLKVRIDGTYYALVDFFRRVAEAERIVSVTDLALGPAEPAGTGVYTVQPNETVGANCVLVTYFNHAAGPPPAAPKKKLGPQKPEQKDGG